jgi:hypothetical protein
MIVIHIILFLFAWAMIPIVTVANFFLVRSSSYFRDTALSIDIFANREYRTLWNKTLRKPNGYEFGFIGETISSALGKNQRDKTLTTAGKVLVWILDRFEQDHCLNSIQYFRKCYALTVPIKWT